MFDRETAATAKCFSRIKQTTTTTSFKSWSFYYSEQKQQSHGWISWSGGLMCFSLRRSSSQRINTFPHLHQLSWDFILFNLQKTNRRTENIRKCFSTLGLTGLSSNWLKKKLIEIFSSVILLRWKKNQHKKIEH